jgi:hypothetical protein
MSCVRGARGICRCLSLWRSLIRWSLSAQYVSHSILIFLVLLLHCDFYASVGIVVLTLHLVTVIFVFDCLVFTQMTVSFSLEEKTVGLTPQILSWVLAVVLPLLTLEQFIASVLIAPKHNPSTSRKSPDTAMLGLKLYLLGICIQELLVGYTIFLAVKISKHTGGRKVDYPLSNLSNDVQPEWRSISYALIFSLAAIAIRIAYRLIELSGIFTGYLLILMHNEVFFYTLECLPVLAAIGIWTLVDTQNLLNEQFSDSASGDAYSYYEVGRESLDVEAILLESGDME